MQVFLDNQYIAACRDSRAGLSPSLLYISERYEAPVLMVEVP